MSCIAARTMLAYVSERCGPGAASDVARASGLPEEYLRDEHHWMEFAAAQAMSERCKEVLGDPRAPYTIALDSARLRTVGPTLVMARALGSPKAAFRIVPRFNRQFTRVVEMDVRSAEEGHAVLTAEYAPSVTPHKNDCLYRQGVLAGVPTLWGLPPAKVEEQECACSGAPRCVYAITWRPLAQRSRVMLAGLFLASALATVGVMVLWPAGALVLAPLAIAVLATLGLRLDRLMRQEREVNREEWTALEQELRTVEEKGDALHAAKVRLEERVAALQAAADHMRDVAATLEMDDLVRVTITRLAAASGATEGFLVLSQPSGAFRVAAVHGASPASLLGHEVPPKLPTTEGLVAWARESGGLSRDAHPVVQPLMKGEEQKGVVVLGCPMPPASDALPEVLALLAGQAAIAIENARLYQLAITDGLTGLFIHRHFLQRLEAEMARVARFGGSMALVMIDLDHFKVLNDTHGHLAGDRVLRDVAATLRRTLRPRLDIVARYGGEELAAILPETDQPGALSAAEKVRAAIAALEWPGDAGPVRVTASIGVSVYAGWEGAAPEAIIQQADEALYVAKRAGRNRVVKSWREAAVDPGRQRPLGAN
ncbi:MAG: diguanylate cyclase [Acidobacteriota bacterium]